MGFCDTVAAGYDGSDSHGMFMTFFRKYILDVCGFVGGLQNSNHVSFMRPLFLNRINFSIMF